MLRTTVNVIIVRLDINVASRRLSQKSKYLSLKQTQNILYLHKHEYGNSVTIQSTFEITLKTLTLITRFLDRMGDLPAICATSFSVFFTVFFEVL